MPYVLAWNEILIGFYEKDLKEIDLSTKIEAYIQYIVCKKILEYILLNIEEITENIQDG